jgi:hypothetical protein
VFILQLLRIFHRGWFDVNGMKAAAVVDKIHKKGIVISSNPYRDSYARFAPSLLNNEQEVELALAETNAMA